MAAILQRNSSGGTIFVIITSIISKMNSSKELFCNHFGQDGTWIHALPKLLEDVNLSGKDQMK